MANPDVISPRDSGPSAGHRRRRPTRLGHSIAALLFGTGLVFAILALTAVPLGGMEIYSDLIHRLLQRVEGLRTRLVAMEHAVDGLGQRAARSLRLMHASAPTPGPVVPPAAPLASTETPVTPGPHTVTPPFPPVPSVPAPRPAIVRPTPDEPRPGSPRATGPRPVARGTSEPPRQRSLVASEQQGATAPPAPLPDAPKEVRSPAPHGPARPWGPRDAERATPAHEGATPGPGRRATGRVAPIEPAEGLRTGDRRERPEHADRTERADRVERAERIERADGAGRVEHVERVERAQGPERVERPERAERPDRMERLERAERPDRVERLERAERPDRVERAERPDRVERVDRVERPQRIERAVERLTRLERPERRGR